MSIPAAELAEVVEVADSAALTTTDAFSALAISLGLGLLVGLQRERADDHIAGIRTFPLITVLGTLSALLSLQTGWWILGAALLGVVAATVVGNLFMLRKTDAVEPGITTEVAVIIMFCVGAYLVLGPRVVAVGIGALTALLLHAKRLLHNIADRLGEKDVQAIMQFVLISFVILPVIPNRTYGPFDVLNPYQIWLMVVLVVGISLGGYLVYKFIGERAGIILGGVLGGLISSTATTVSYARRAKSAGGQATAAAIVITTASTIVYGRVLLEIKVVAPNHFVQMAPPIIAVALISVVILSILWLRTQKENAELPEQGNPTELKSALFFGGMYAVVLFVAAAAKDLLGDAALYPVAVISGLTDMDAITLSTARLVDEGRLESAMGWRVVLTAALSNLVFKAGLVLSLGSRGLFRIIAIVFGSSFVGAIIIMVVWQESWFGFLNS